MKAIEFDRIRPGDRIRAVDRDVLYEGTVKDISPSLVAAESGQIIGFRTFSFYLLERPVEQSPTKPTVGRTVLFRARTDGVVSAATILRTRESTVSEGLEGWERSYPKGFVRELKGSTVDLLVHGLTGDYREYAVPYSTHPSKRTWGWPEKS